MASIAGIISQHGRMQEDSTKQLRKMLRLTRHRGQDNSIIRTLFDDRGAVGANEINLTPKRTYCTSLEERPYLLFDGELFNQRPEGQSDLDLLMEHYEKYDQKCFSR
ncbi:MAG: hypothetical protein ACLFUE_08775, partial [Desulfobacteraceae bacterium]